MAPVTVVPLTSRERDIATLAARGEPSKAIADRLFLSVRTVNNHLQNVYSKLGVAGRRQLAGALADLDVTEGTSSRLGSGLCVSENVGLLACSLTQRTGASTASRCSCRRLPD